MAAHKDSVTIQVELPRADYKRIEAQARKESLPVAQVIPELVSSELRRREKARRLMLEASRSYRARLVREGKLDQIPAEIFAELRGIREEVANDPFLG